MVRRSLVDYFHTTRYLPFALNILLAETVTVAFPVQSTCQATRAGRALGVLVIADSTFSALGAGIARFANTVPGLVALVPPRSVRVAKPRSAKSVTDTPLAGTGIETGDAGRAVETLLALVAIHAGRVVLKKLDRCLKYCEYYTFETPSMNVNYLLTYVPCS